MPERDAERDGDKHLDIELRIDRLALLRACAGFDSHGYGHDIPPVSVDRVTGHPMFSRPEATRADLGPPFRKRRAIRLAQASHAGFAGVKAPHRRDADQNCAIFRSRAAAIVR